MAEGLDIKPSLKKPDLVKTQSERLQFLLLAPDSTDENLPSLPKPFAPVLRPKRKSGLSLKQNLQTALHFEAQHGTPFIWAIICFALGCLIYFTWPHEPALRPLVLGLAVLSTIIYLAKNRATLKVLAIAAACIILGVLASKLHIESQSTDMLGSEVNTTLTARVIQFEDLADGRKRLLLDIIKTEKPELHYIKGQLRLSFGGDAKFSPGDIVQGRARLFPPGGPAKPGGFDFAYQAFSANLAATGIFFGAPKKQPPPTKITISTGLRVNLEKARQAIEQRIKTSLTGKNGDLATALVTGRKTGIADADNEALRITGLAHILSISGLHMALVSGAVLFTIRASLALFPAFSAMRSTKKWAALGALIVATLYLGISGGGIATQRSYVMIAIILVAVLVDRQALTMRNLALAALVVLAIRPSEILNAGFHMSFAATAALIAAYAGLTRWRDSPLLRQLQMRTDRPAFRFGNYLLTFFAGLAATSIIAGAATSLYSIYHFERYAPYGIIANMAAMPMVSLIVMPAGLAAMLLSPFNLDHYAWLLMGKGIEYVVWVAHTIARWTPYDGTGAVPGLAVLAGTCALLLLTALKSRLALLAIIPLGIGLWSLSARNLPLAYVHERGDTVGIINNQGDLAINRARVSDFITDQWRRSLTAKAITKPKSDKNLTLLALWRTANAPLNGNQPNGFLCNQAMCIYADPVNITLFTIKTSAALHELCNVLGEGAISAPRATLIYEGVVLPAACKNFKSQIINKQNLALGGSVALYLDAQTKQINRVATLQNIERPWHRYRAYSRAARGMEDYKPKSKDVSETKP